MWISQATVTWFSRTTPLYKTSPNNSSGVHVLPPQASDISARSQLVRSEGRNLHPRYVCCWGVNIRQRWHPCSYSCPSPALSCVTDRTWRARGRSRSAGLESHERHSFLCISNWLTCNHYGSNAIFQPQDFSWNVVWKRDYRWKQLVKAQQSVLT